MLYVNEQCKTNNIRYIQTQNKITFRGHQDLNGADIIDIKARGKYPANILSNFAPTNFELDGIKINSMEGFLQSLKTDNPQKQKEICAMTGFEAKTASHAFKQSSDDILYFWDGKSFTKYSDEFKKLVVEISQVQRQAGNKPFVFHGYNVSSVNAFLMAIRSQDVNEQKLLSSTPKENIKEVSKTIHPSYAPRTLYWNGKSFSRDSEEYQTLIRRAYEAKFDADYEFRKAIRVTKKQILAHSKGKDNVSDTILTKQEFIDALNNLRKRDNLKLRFKDTLRTIFKAIIK